jgi:hypothetical protein
MKHENKPEDFLTFSVNICSALWFEKELWKLSHANRTSFAIIACYATEFPYFEEYEESEKSKVA